MLYIGADLVSESPVDDLNDDDDDKDSDEKGHFLYCHHITMHNGNVYGMYVYISV